MGYVKVNMHTRCVPNFASKALDNAITNPSRVEILLNLEGQMDKIPMPYLVAGPYKAGAQPCGTLDAAYGVRRDHTEVSLPTTRPQLL